MNLIGFAAKMADLFLKKASDDGTVKFDFMIPLSNLPKLKESFKEIYNKAQKNNLEAPTLQIGPTSLKNVRVLHKNEVELREVQCANVIITSQALIINGWEIIAKLEHLAEGNMIKKMDPSAEIPESYRNSYSNCDHCKTKRPRNQTYLIKKDSVIRQLGGECVKLFADGFDLKNIAAMLEDLKELSKFEDADEEKVKTSYDVVSFLARAACSIRMAGWAKSSDANPTWSEAIYSKLSPTAEDKALAENTVNFIKEMKGNVKSDYEHNLYVAVTDHVVTPKTAPIAASAILFYKNKNVISSAEWVGEVGKKYSGNLKVIKTFALASQYGVINIYTMEDADKNIFVWKTAGEELEEGKSYQITGTIKEHSTYRDVKQTVLTRCKVNQAEKKELKQKEKAEENKVKSQLETASLFEKVMICINNPKHKENLLSIMQAEWDSLLPECLNSTDFLTWFANMDIDLQPCKFSESFREAVFAEIVAKFNSLSGKLELNKYGYFKRILTNKINNKLLTKFKNNQLSTDDVVFDYVSRYVRKNFEEQLNDLKKPDLTAYEVESKKTLLSRDIYHNILYGLSLSDLVEIFKSE